MKIDEHALAGYISGELNDAQRSEVTSALLQDGSMRQWLAMATEALAAARSGEADGIMSRIANRMESSRPGVRRQDRHAIPNSFRARRVG
ncbi:MAG: hypothetical protein ACPG8N_06815 [Rhodothermales bacterium]